jgi:uncharacterized membrane protein YphA (DoxX/SURF4 family)
MSLNNKEKIFIILRIALGIVFLLASWDKILDPKGFVRVVQNYAILPPVLAKFTAIVLPWIEAVSGILLISGCYIRGSAVIVSGLMLVFISALAWNMYRGIDVTCGCFSNELKAATTGDYVYEIMRDILILGAGLLVFFYKIGQDSSNRRLS